MATFQFEGVDDLLAQYERLAKDSEGMIGRAIYQGAAVVMNAVLSAIDGINTDDRYMPPGNMKSGPTTYQKRGLRQSVGIAKMRQDDTFWNVKIGFDGYNGIQTKKWPKGQPNAMVARSVESGTSWMQKQPFMRKAEQGSRARCEQAMAKEIDKELTNLIKES